MGLGPATYDLTACILMLGGVHITGFGDGDVIKFTHDEDLAEKTTGADGKTVYSRLGNDAMECEIILLPTSKAYPLLMEQQKAQHPNGPGVQIAPLPFLCRDTINGETVSSSACVFMNRPEVTFGKTVGERTFRVSLPEAGGSMIANVNN